MGFFLRDALLWVLLTISKGATSGLTPFSVPGRLTPGLTASVFGSVLCLHTLAIPRLALPEKR